MDSGGETSEAVSETEWSGLEPCSADVSEAWGTWLNEAHARTHLCFAMGLCRSPFLRPLGTGFIRQLHTHQTVDGGLRKERYPLVFGASAQGPRQAQGQRRRGGACRDAPCALNRKHDTEMDDASAARATGSALGSSAADLGGLSIYRLSWTKSEKQRAVRGFLIRSRFIFLGHQLCCANQCPNNIHVHAVRLDSTTGMVRELDLLKRLNANTPPPPPPPPPPRGAVNWHHEWRRNSAHWGLCLAPGHMHPCGAHPCGAQGLRSGDSWFWKWPVFVDQWKDRGLFNAPEVNKRLGSGTQQCEDSTNARGPLPAGPDPKGGGEGLRTPKWLYGSIDFAGAGNFVLGIRQWNFCCHRMCSYSKGSEFRGEFKNGCPTHTKKLRPPTRPPGRTVADGSLSLSPTCVPMCVCSN